MRLSVGQGAERGKTAGEHARWRTAGDEALLLGHRPPSATLAQRAFTLPPCGDEHDADRRGTLAADVAELDLIASLIAQFHLQSPFAPGRSKSVRLRF